MLPADPYRHRPSRREILALASAGAAAAGVSVLSAGSAAATDAVVTAGGACLLTPEAIPGPYYFDPKLVRSDITEGHRGVPVKLRLRVVGADCHPVAGARVDVWHADAQGLYSGYRRQGDARNLDTAGQTFLRGTQLADDSGEASFDTIFPGWYTGRTAHIHFKVFLDQATILTAQLYFPDAINEFIYTQVADYRRRHKRDTINATDPIARAATDAAFASVKEETNHYLVSLLVGVNPATHPTDEGGGPNGPPPGRPREAAILPGHPRRLSRIDRVRALVPGSSGS